MDTYCSILVWEIPWIEESGRYNPQGHTPLGLQSLVHIGCCMQDASSFLQVSFQGPQLSTHVSTALDCKENIQLFLQHLPGHSMQPLKKKNKTLGFCHFTWFYLGEQLKDTFALRLLKSILWFPSFPFVKLSLRKGQAQDLDVDASRPREHIHHQYSRYIFSHVPRILSLKIFLLRYNLHILKCTNHKYIV